MEESKRKSRREGSEKEEKRSSNRDRDERVREKDRNDRDRDRESRHDREKSVDDSKHRDVEKHKDRHRDKDREDRKSRDKDKEDREKRLKEKEREREREREKERERRERKEKEKERERKDREREKERERKDRDRYREREKRRDRSNSGDEEDVVREKEKKRRRREVDDDKSRDVREGSQEIRSRGKGDDEVVVRKEKSREERMAEEKKILEDEAEKRKKRVQEWQERKRKEEAERAKTEVEENKESGKAWTLDGESDDEESAPDGKSNMNVDDGDEAFAVIPNGDGGNGMDIDSANEVSAAVQNGAANTVEEDEIDPLDAYMNSMVLPEVENLNKTVLPASDVSRLELVERNGKTPSQPLKKGTNRNMGRIIQGEDSDLDYEDSDNNENQSDDENDEQWSKRLKKTKVEKLSIVDHSKIDYPPFRKNFYTEVKEIEKMTPEEVAEYRVELELKLHGKDVPKPIKSWHQTGLSTKILDIIRKLNYEKPMSIQAQALPIIMSGRDCIGIAKTGSGKTLAFVLPMLRHIKDQPPLMSGDGPIGLIMAPTRELVKQIYTDIKKFTKGMGLTCVPVYGGSGVAQQISDLKRGAEIVVCTPGRMIDILCTSAGKITNLRRVTYLVMDEADRMFDMGFEPQITRIVQNTRPDRQTVLFSATFPRQVETLARKVLNKPVEIQVGGRSVVNKDITQLVEVRPENDRFLRLLEVLGEWYEKGKVLIFVHTQDKCDSLFKDLLKAGYPCLSLHGAKDQTDRESTLADFKGDVCNLLIATSIAARGLDVKELELVVNFDAPNHYEDYVHRVGRTGRAGRKGCAITFISEEDARYAPDLVKALELSEQSVPADLKALADSFNVKVNQGQEQIHGTGYGGSGYKFNQEEDEARKAEKKAQAKSHGYVEEKSDSEDEDEDVKKAGGEVTHESILAQVAAFKANTANGGLPVSLPGVLGLTVPPVVPGNDGAARAAALAAAMNLKYNLAKIQADAMPEHYEAELEINDFPQNARWKVTHKDTLGPISEWTGAAITTRGQYHEPGKIAGPGDRKLYLFIEGPTEQSVKKAKAELKRVLEDITTQASSLPGSAQQPGRYSVI